MIQHFTTTLSKSTGVNVLPPYARKDYHHTLLTVGYVLPVRGRISPLTEGNLQLTSYSLPDSNGSFPLIGNSLPLRGESLPIFGYSLPLRDKILPLPGYSLPLRDNFLPLRSYSLPLRNGSLPLRGYSLRLPKDSLPEICACSKNTSGRIGASCTCGALINQNIYIHVTYFLN